MARIVVAVVSLGCLGLLWAPTSSTKRVFFGNHGYYVESWEETRYGAFGYYTTEERLVMIGSGVTVPGRPQVKTNWPPPREVYSESRLWLTVLATGLVLCFGGLAAWRWGRTTCGSEVNCGADEDTTRL